MLTSPLAEPEQGDTRSSPPATEHKAPLEPLEASPPLVSAVSTMVCAGAAVAGWALGDTAVAPWLFALAYLAGGSEATLEAVRQLLKGKLSIDLLMIAAAFGAAFIGEWLEGAILLFLFSLSHTLEAYAMYRTTRSIDALLQLRPREASRVRDGVEERVALEGLVPSDRVIVRPGEQFPVDGQVVEGETSADESTLTGESESVSKRLGDPVFAGTINGAGYVVIEMTREVADTTLERIVQMVREAQAAQTPTQRFVESWQGPYAGFVLAASAFVFLVNWLWQGTEAPHAFYHAMVLLVVMSPCAVVIGSPAVTLSAIARAARHGVLFKGGAYLEALGLVEVIAFDKTGTITYGKPAVTEVWTEPGVDPDWLLARAASIENRSEHSLGAAVLNEAESRSLPLDDRLAEFHCHSGQGVHAHLNGEWVGIGRESLFQAHEVALPAELERQAEQFRAAGQTALIVGVAGHHREVKGGVIAVADQLRPQAAEALRSLKRLGIKRTVILTGDHERVAQAVARQVEADDFRAGLLPEEKVVEIRRLRNNSGPLAMVGDGVNDAPALAVADVGIAMGGRGTDVALETADVVLMRDNLSALPFAVWLSRQSRRRIRQNLLIAFSVIGVLSLASFYGLRLWLGVLGHEGSTVIVVLNGLRLFIDQPPAFLDRST